MYRAISILIITLLTFILVDANQNIVVNPTTKRFLDTYGREVYFHGVNVVYKNPPWYAPNGAFDIHQSFGEQDMEYLSEWGLNIVRLGVMWVGVEPDRGVYNQTYLNFMRNVVDTMDQYGLYALIDCHQDLYSWVFCGDGAPQWASYTPSSGIGVFPEPVSKPYIVNNNTFVPSNSDCGKHDWGSYYMADTVCKSFQNLYDNVDGIQDAFSGYWQQVANTFKTSTNTIGYELINEPWAGDVYEDPMLLFPGVADKKNLQPMYDRLNGDIRSIDPDHIIFFEPVTWDEVGVGFDTVPGGDNYRNQSALSYHYYVPPDVSVKETFWARMRDLDKLQCGGMLTEFGDTAGDDPTTLQTTIETMNEAEINMQSWIFWLYKDFSVNGSSDFFFNTDGTPDPVRVKLFSRTYAQAVAGTTYSTHFDSNSGNFTITYETDPSIFEPTEIYLNEQSYYPNGYNVELTPSNVATYSSITNKLFIKFSSHTPSNLTVLVYPN